MASAETSGAEQPGGRAALAVAGRLAWIGVRLILVLCLGEKGVLFLYQGF
jgi:hypothetical protein